MRGRKLRNCVYLEGTLKQKGVKQMGRKTGPMYTVRLDTILAISRKWVINQPAKQEMK
jgi:hypothetical protein